MSEPVAQSAYSIRRSRFGPFVPAARLLENSATLMIVSVLTIMLFAAGNLPWQLEDYDQAKQAFTSWQIVTAPHLLYQQTPSGKVATKPPLVAWISAFLYRVTRSWEIAWRAPSFAAALALGTLLWRRAAVIAGAAGGLIALAAFSLNLLTPRLATLVRTDMPLALVTFLIALLFFDKIRRAQRWQARDRALLFLLLSAGMLIKGPIVYAFVLPAMVLFAWRYRGTAQAQSIATGWWPWIISLALFLAWAVAGIETVPGFYDEVVVREFAGRFGETLHRPQPLYFYLPHLLQKWAPWSLLLIGLLVADFRAARLPPETPAATTGTAVAKTAFGETAAERKKRWFSQLTPEIFWLLASGVGGLIVMSCIPSKRVDRIFPVVPPLCLAAGVMSGLAVANSDRLARWFAITLAGAVVLSSSYTVARIVSGYRCDRGALVKCARDLQTRARQNGRRFALLRDDNEALVVYLQLPGFLRQGEAVEAWNSGKLEALIGSEERMRALLPQLAQNGELRHEPLCPNAPRDEHYLVISRAAPP